MSLPQDRNRQQPDIPQFEPDPLPPTVKIIECSCAQAESRSDNNDTWTNIIKEPIMVKKGSEMRINQSFIDMRGMDQDIIQFQSTTDTQDNSHTLLCQHYTVNDGFNNKTTTYDYIASHGGKPVMVDCGANFHFTAYNVPYHANAVATGGSTATNVVVVVQGKAHGLRPVGVGIPAGIVINNGGSRYSNGDIFKIGNDITGYVVVNEVGSVTDMILTTNVSDNPITGQPVFESTNGVNLNITINPSINCLEYVGLVNPDKVHSSRGTGCKVGDILSIDEAPGGITANVAKLEVRSVYFGQGSLNEDEYFDQGYNYEKAPVYRWAQTFDLNEAFSYGFGGDSRSFISEGQQVGVTNATSHQENDPCLSCGALLVEKEDEFVSGIFHTSTDDNDFYLNAPVLYFKPDSSSGAFTLQSQTNSGFTITMANQDVTINGLTVKGNPLNTMPLGSTYQIYFRYKDIAAPTSAQKITLADFATDYAVPCKVTSVDFGETNTTVSLNSDPDYKGVLSDFYYRDPGYTGIPNHVFTVDLIFQGSDDGGAAPTQPANVEVTTDGAGNISNITLVDGGLGHRKGMLYTIGAAPTPLFLCTGVDERYGWDLPITRDIVLNNSSLTLGTDDLEMFLIPIQQYNQRNDGNMLQYREVNVNPTIGNRYPITLKDVPLTTAGQTGTGITDTVANGMYRSKGILDPVVASDRTLQSAAVNHDSDTNLTPVSTTGNVIDINVRYSAATDPTSVITPFNTISFPQNGFWTEDPTNIGEQTLRIRQATWNALGHPLPEYRYIIFEGQLSPTLKIECHVQTGGLTVVDATYYYIQIVSTSTVTNQITTQKLSPATKVFLGIGQDYMRSSFQDTGLVNLNALSPSDIRMIFVEDPLEFNTKITLRWGENRGSLGVTGMQNFFGSNDPNLPSLSGQPISSVEQVIRSTYDEGGYYYLTRFTGSLTTKDGTTVPYDLTNYNNFNSGLDNFPLGTLPSSMYSWRSDYQPASVENLQQSYTNITKYWKYEPLYRQKTLTINKDFCVATDISGIWNDAAHKLTGAINPSNGEVYVDEQKSGILQNEFIMPVYGSSSRIDAAGNYILDNERFSESAGLEPGHCIGRSYIQQDNGWLAKSMIHQLPKDENGYTYYNIFFRTGFTKIRGYDPLKSKTIPKTSAISIVHFPNPLLAGSPERTTVQIPRATLTYLGVNLSTAGLGGLPFYVGQQLFFNTSGERVVTGVSIVGTNVELTYDQIDTADFAQFNGAVSLQILEGTQNEVPDKTPLSTVNNTADKVGNAGKNALNGALIGSGAGTRLFELGEAAGLPAATTNPVRFGTRNFYPIFYLDESRRGEYKYAKISQYVGSTELALVFDTSISNFAFQYLHQPFTSEFIDDQGGEESIRVWFGNRRDGILNHDAVGGLLVVNYCRPDFPRNVFTRRDISENLPNGAFFPNGLDPLKSVSKVGRAFLLRLGFSDKNLGIINGQLDTNSDQLSFKLTPYPDVDITNLMDGNVGTDTYQYKSYDSSFYGTTGANIDTSDAILSQIPAPESNAGLESHNVRVNNDLGRSVGMLRKFGDFIFYPYGFNTANNSFESDTSIVRYDNCTSSFGAIGGMLQSNSSRGMGIPNVLGSLANVDQDTIPVQLNPDCLLYTSYTIKTTSAGKYADNLPLKLTNAYLLVLSSLMKQTNLYMSSTGWVNSMAVANKTFIQGDYILAQGTESFYATEDFVLSEITTTIRDSNYQAPSVLGTNSSIIYQITNYNPVPDKQYPTIEEEQLEAMQLQQLVAEHQNYNQGGKISRIEQLNADFYNLGLSIITSSSGDIIQAVKNQIAYHDLPSLTQRERTQFLQTPEGQLLVQNATDIQMIRSHLNDIDALPDDEELRPRTNAIRRNAEGEINQRYDNIIARTPEFYFQADEPPPSPPEVGDDVLAFFGDVERDAAMRSLTTERVGDLDSPRESPRKRAARVRGKGAARRGGYTQEDIAKMVGFGERMKFGEGLERRERVYQRDRLTRGVPTVSSESGFYSIPEEEEEEP